MLILAKDGSFAPLDWAVLVGYFALVAGTGWWFSRREVAGAREYFLAGRQMPMWAVAVSVLATATSAATFIGVPEIGFKSNLTYLSTNIGMFIAVAVVAVYFIPAYFRNNVMTVYDLLERRFGPGGKLAASWTFLLGRVLASGSRLFMAGIPLSLILFNDAHPAHLAAGIGVLTVVAILYTLVGGIRSIIWTDVIQTVVFVGAAGAALVMLRSRIPLPLGEIAGALSETRVDGGSKLAVLNLSANLTQPYTIWSVALAFSLLGIASYGTDHDLAQRMLTCRSAVKGSQSVVVAILLNLPVLLVFISIGLLLHIFYGRPDLMGGFAPEVQPEHGREVFLSFILNEMPRGMRGLMMAGLFAAGLGSTLSAINAMSAAFVNDCYRKMRPAVTDRECLVIGRWAVVGWGLILGSFACICILWQEGSGKTLIDFALSVMTFAYAGLLGVFFTAIFTRRGNTTSAIAALVVGFLVVLLFQEKVWGLLTSGMPPAIAGFHPAWPWHLFAGTIAATSVCCLGNPAPRAPAETGA